MNENKGSSPFGDYVWKNLIDKKGRKYFTSVNEMAKNMNVSRQYLYLLLSGHQKISPSLATRLGRLTSKDPALYLKLGRDDYSDEHIYTKDIDDLIEHWKQNGSRQLIKPDIISALKTGLFKLKPFDPESVQVASVDLSIGDKVLVYNQNGNKQYEISENKNHLLKPGEIAEFETLEHVTMPNCILGNLGSMTHLCANHIQLLYGALCDPGYDNKLMLSIKNIGFEGFNIVKGLPIVTMSLIFLPDHVENIEEIKHSYENLIFEKKDDNELENSKSNDNKEKSIEQFSHSLFFLELKKSNFSINNIKSIYSTLELNDDKHKILDDNEIFILLEKEKKYLPKQILDVVEAYMTAWD